MLAATYVLCTLVFIIVMRLYLAFLVIVHDCATCYSEVFKLWSQWSYISLCITRTDRSQRADIIFLVWYVSCSLPHWSVTYSIHSAHSSHCPSEQCEGGESEQHQSCPCQLDPTHPSSGKRVPCVLCDISTLFTSWASGAYCQHDWLQCNNLWPQSHN